MGGPSAPYISDQNAIKHDASGGHTTVAGVSKVRPRVDRLRVEHMTNGMVL